MDVKSKFPAMKCATHTRKIIKGTPISPVTTKEASYGVCIGILTSDNKIPFAGNKKNFSELITTGLNMGVKVFVLTPKSFEQGIHDLFGYTLDLTTKKQKWIKTKVPIPTVIYNRIPNRKVEKTNKMQQVLGHIKKELRIPLFNNNFFDKWTLYDYISSSSALINYIPETKQLNKYNLFNMLQSHPIIYLKPIEGKAGSGLIRISKVLGKYRIEIQKNKKKEILCDNLYEIPEVLSTLSWDEKYIIQQGIKLSNFNGSPFDIRILVQKDGTGKWNTTGIGVRVAGDEAISTHVPMGGRIECVDEVLYSVFPLYHRQLLDKLKQLSLQIAEHIEKKNSNILGEMSMDIGIDGDRNIWFFEANAKPMKFDEPGIRLESLRNIIKYGSYLTHQKQYKQRVTTI